MDGRTLAQHAQSLIDRLDQKVFDANPRQIALLELKLAGIRRLEFEDFSAVFGEGHHSRFGSLYRAQLRDRLSPFARAYWDRNGRWFCELDAADTIYYDGLSGVVGRKPAI